MKEHHIKITRTARFYTLGELNENTKHIWFVLHGYGQLAQYFIKKFEVLAENDTFIIAPEALSRHYLKNFGGRVGATWITKEDRLNEIDDYVNYLNDVYDVILKDFDPKNVQIHLVGFSQGASTVCRWLDNQHIKCNNLILWAGYFANGITEVINPEKLKNIPVYYVYGTNDEFINDENVEAMKFMERIKEEISPTILSFDGGHAIDTTTLLNLAKMVIVEP